jgi:hypothetical protein
VAGCACAGDGGGDHAARTGGARGQGEATATVLTCLSGRDLRVARLGHNFVGLGHSTCYLLGVLEG